MAVTKRTRFEVLRRDNHQCRYCGATAPDAPLTVDHVIPVTLGGSDDPSNLVTACRDCNAGKSSTSPDEGVVADVSADALRWKAAMQEAADVVIARRNVVGDYCAAFEAEWESYGRRLYRNDWVATLESMHAAGLPEQMMLEAVSIACTTRGVEDRFRYFCGIAWRMTGEIQDAAKQILSQGGSA